MGRIQKTNRKKKIKSKKTKKKNKTKENKKKKVEKMEGMEVPLPVSNAEAIPLRGSGGGKNGGDDFITEVPFSCTSWRNGTRADKSGVYRFLWRKR